ncbi:MAG: discoidin domain-containing protein, partial [Polyangiales bacterium]
MAEDSRKRSNASHAVRALAGALVFALGLAPSLRASAQPAARPAAQPASPALPAPAATPAPAAAANPCTTDNLVLGALVGGTGFQGVSRTTQDGQLATEGALWNSPAGVNWQGAAPELVYDLHAPAELQYLVLQGDNNDNYTVEGSADGTGYRLLWTAEPDSTGPGLRTRFVVLPKRESARYLRVKASGGDGYYSLSELRAYCKAPLVWPPAVIKPPRLYNWHGIDNDVMVWIKMLCAGFGVLVLLTIWGLELAGALRPRGHKRGRPRWGYIGAALCGAFTAWNLYYIADGKKSLIGAGIGLSVALVLLLLAYDLWRPLPWRRGDSALALVGLMGFFGWWNFGHYHFDHYVHIWEHYHYYIGAKYGPELRYSRIYSCTSAVDVLDGMRARVKKREMRDLAVTNELGPSDAIVDNPLICTKHFSTERWAAFREDIRFFRNHFPADRWDESQTDHGYNGTPVWAILGRLIANYKPLTWTKIQVMAGIDSALLVLMWVVALWAFGWRASCVAMMWWGFNFPARYYWNGGSFLRYDWIFWLVTGICLLKKRYHFGAGLALTYATLLRVFPGFVVAALILKALARIIRMRRLVISRGHLRFAMGCILALAVLIPASGWATGGLDAWKEFALNSRKHLSTPLTNNMGLKTALGYDADTSAKYLRNSNLHDPFADWKHARNFY